jgi:hypothetical protein
VTVRIEADEGEKYPAAFVSFEDEAYFGFSPGRPRFDLSDEDAADLRQARDAWRAWERRLLDMIDPPGAVQGTPQSMGLLEEPRE